MRFHFGVSFRLRTLKKFIFPFLIGLLSYLGFNYFNLLEVNALANFSSYFNLNYYEQDYSNIQMGDYNAQELLDAFYGYDSPYYNIVVNIYYNATNYFINYNLVPKNVTNVTGNYIYSQFNTGLTTTYKNAGGYYVSFSNLGNQTNSITYQKLVACLDTNVCDFNDNYTNIGLVRVANGVSYSSNTLDYDVDVVGNYEYLLLYYSQVPLNYYQYNAGTRHNSKAIKVNDTIVNDGDPFLTYCDFFSCGSSSDDSNTSFELFLNKQPYIYSNIDINNISSYSINYRYDVVNITLDTYLENLIQHEFYYGRINNNGYYSYQKLNCSSSAVGSSDGTTVNITFNNFNCTDNLSSYDKFFVTIYPYYEDSSLDYSISGFQATSNGFINHTTSWVNNFLDNYELASGFKVLVSTNDTLNNQPLYIYSNNDYTGIDLLPNADSSLSVTTNGSWYKDLPYPKSVNFGNVTNKMVMIYDDTSYSNVNSTKLWLYLRESMIVSFPNNDTFYHYDDSQNIVSNTITLNYDNLESTSNYSSVEQYFIQVNNFMNGINEDLFSYHNILQSVYDVIPTFLQLCLNILYILLLSYLLFKFIRK